MSTAVIKIRKEPYYRREAIEKGLKRLGYNLSQYEAPPAGPKDLLIIWNRKAGIEDNAATLWEQRGGSVIVMENGYLARTEKTMYAVSVHGHNGSGWFPFGTEDRFSKLGFEVKPWRHATGGHWLVCGQRGIGSPTMASPPQWAEKTCRALRHVPTRLRQHPGNHAPKTPLLDDLANAHCCVIWSSGSGVRALVEGVPVYYDAPHWICSGAATRLADALVAYTPTVHELARQVALHRMAHGQWSVDEIASGEPFARILDQLEHAKWP